MGPLRDDESPASGGSAHEIRLRELATNVALRLQRVCAALPPDELAALARQIAEVTIKYDEITHERPVVVEPTQALRAPDPTPHRSR